MSFKAARPDELIDFAYDCSALLLSALKRECPSVIKKQELRDSFNGQPITRDFRNNFQDPYNLDLLDKLIMPIFKELIGEAERRGMATAVRTAFGKEGIYAIEVLGGAKAKNFEEIHQIVHGDRQKPVLRLVSAQTGVPAP